MQMSGGKKATAGTVIGGGLNSSSGGELKLYLDWKRNTAGGVTLSTLIVKRGGMHPTGMLSCFLEILPNTIDANGNLKSALQMM